MTRKMTPDRTSRTMRSSSWEYDTHLKMEDIISSFIDDSGHFVLRMTPETALALHRSALYHTGQLSLTPTTGFVELTYQCPSGPMKVIPCEKGWKPFIGFDPLPDGVGLVYRNIKGLPAYLFDFRGPYGKICKDFSAIREALGFAPKHYIKVRKDALWNF